MIAAHRVKHELWRLLTGIAVVAVALLATYAAMDAYLARAERAQDEFHVPAQRLSADLGAALAQISLPPGVPTGAVLELDDELAFVSAVTREFGRAQALLQSLIALHAREAAPAFSRAEARLVRAAEELRELDQRYRGEPLALARTVSVRALYASIVAQQTQRLHEEALRELHERVALAQRTFSIAFSLACLVLGLALAVQLRRSLRGIDEILRAERRTREHARAVLEAVPDLWFVLDSEGRFVEVSDPAHPNLDRPWPQLEGRVFVPVPAATSDVGDPARALGRSGAHSFDYEVAPDARGARSFEARLAPTGDGGWLYLSRDITERKRNEQALARSHEELEREVASRTVQLTIARDAAESANRAKSDFLSRMSHELRTPMNAVLGFAQLLGLDTTASERQRQFVDHILRAGKHLLHLINDVLDLAHVESGRITLSPEPLGVEPIVAEVVALMRPLAQTHQVRLDALPMAGTVVRGDRVRLKQVLLNLVANAVKYNHRDGWVRVEAEAAGDGRVRIVVEDNGPGIPEKAADRLFEPFSRLGAEETTIEGTGIGLSISKRLVELMGGSIGVDSDPGRGSRFWVELPSDRLAPAPAELPTAAGDIGPAAAEREACVLYVEDNPDNLALIIRVVERHAAVRLISAPLAALGFDLARSHRPDLILLDIHLPDMDGYALLEKLRSHDETRAIPTVAVTANAMPQEETRARQAGFAAFLTKPVDVRRFDAMLREMLGRSGPTAEGDAPPDD